MYVILMLRARSCAKPAPDVVRRSCAVVNVRFYNTGHLQHTRSWLASPRDRTPYAMLLRYRRTIDRLSRPRAQRYRLWEYDAPDEAHEVSERFPEIEPYLCDKSALEDTPMPVSKYGCTDELFASLIDYRTLELLAQRAAERCVRGSACCQSYRTLTLSLTSITQHLPGERAPSARRVAAERQLQEPRKVSLARARRRRRGARSTARLSLGSHPPRRRHRSSPAPNQGSSRTTGHGISRRCPGCGQAPQQQGNDTERHQGARIEAARAHLQLGCRLQNPHHHHSHQQCAKCVHDHHDDGGDRVGVVWLLRWFDIVLFIRCLYDIHGGFTSNQYCSAKVLAGAREKRVGLVHRGIG